MDQEQRVTAVRKAISQARDAVDTTDMPLTMWYLTQLKQASARLGPFEDHDQRDYALSKDSEWLLVRAQYEALLQLGDAVERAVALWRH